MSLIDQLAEDDGDTIRALRSLKAQLDAGAIDRQQYAAAYRAIDRSVGKPCDQCGHIPAVVRSSRRALCGGCALAGGR